jgi:negative regulator of flagellin synthesis FlgM
MKIGQLDNSPKVGALDARTRNAGAAAGTDGKAGPAAAPEASAKVELSAAASLLAAQGNTADFDAQKVARIAQAIRQGQFEVNAEAIADQLIAHTRDLLGPKGR